MFTGSAQKNASEFSLGGKHSLNKWLALSDYSEWL